MNTHTVFILLLVLTGASALGASTHQTAWMLLGLGFAKLLLVAFRFMELRKAHVVWKLLVAGLPALLVTISVIVLR